MKATAYPLYWPEGVPRSRTRERPGAYAVLARIAQICDGADR